MRHGQANDWCQTLELNGSQIAAYVQIAIAHLLNALPENPTDVIAGVIALRRRMTDEANLAAAAESGHVAMTQPATRRVAPVSTARNTAVTTVEHNNK